jgi:hypothetical protein
VLHFAFLVAMATSAMVAFLYVWKKGILSFEEDVKYQSFEDDHGR